MNGIELLLVFAPQNFRDQELFCAIDVFTRRGFAPVLASTLAGPARGMLGTEVDATVAVDWVAVDSLDAVVVVGGDGAARSLSDNLELRRLLRTVNGRGGIIGAGCEAITTLARAGIVRGREVARCGDPRVMAEVRDGAGELRERPMVVSDNVVTLGDVAHAPAWCETLAGMLAGYAVANGATMEAPEATP